MDFWIDSSDKDLVTMNHLYTSQDYSWSLFIGHLVIEKLLKAYYIKMVGEHPLFTHDLLRLAEKCRLETSKEHADWLEVITRFNLKARYEDYKSDFRNICTPEFTIEWIEKNQNAKTMVKREALEIARKFLSSASEHFSFKRAYLFGSFAKENSHVDSDIDIAVVIDQNQFTFNNEMELVRLRRDIDLRIEPHIFLNKDFNESSPLVHEILKHGICISLI